jgi:deoxyribonuclease-4
MRELLFGTAGIPLSAKGSGTVGGIAQVRKLGLGAMELEFVRSINIQKQTAPEVRKAAEKNNVVLTCHAPYFINLNSTEATKLKASIARIVDSARIANLCGGYSVCFHAGFYMKSSKEKTYENIKKNLKKIMRALKDEGNGIWVRPETTGKASQFGDLRELIGISSEIEGIMPCIDFSHLHARSNGQINSNAEFSQILTDIEKELGRAALNNMHIHVSGIAYSAKGEKHHLNLEDSDFNYMDLLKTLKEFKAKGVLISESPNIEGDALLMKRRYV